MNKKLFWAAAIVLITLAMSIQVEVAPTPLFGKAFPKHQQHQPTPVAQVMLPQTGGELSPFAVNQEAERITVFIKAKSMIPPHTLPDNPGDLPKEQMAVGAGYLDQDNVPFITTVAHVVEGMKDIYVRFDDKGGYKKVHVVGWSPKEYFDLARLEFDEIPKDLPKPGALGDSENIKSRDVLYTLGQPLTMEFAGSAGEAKRSGRTYNPPILEEFNSIQGYILIDMKCNHGNSGGPVLDNKGKIVGLVDAITDPETTDPICLAVPINNYKKLADKLKEPGEVNHGFLGVKLEDSWRLTPDEKAKSGILPNEKLGVYVSDVIKGSPAEKADFKIGDKLLYFSNGAAEEKIPVEFGTKFFEDLYLNFFAGDLVQFTFERDGGIVIKSAILVDPALFVPQKEKKKEPKDKKDN